MTTPQIVMAAFAGWFSELPSGMSYRLWEQGGHEQRPGDVALYESAGRSEEAMPKRMTMKLELTDAQRELLEPMFQAVRDANKLGAEVAIFAQVWPDGFVAMTANPLEVGAIRATFGHTSTGVRLSAQHWVEAQDEKAALARLGA